MVRIWYNPLNDSSTGGTVCAKWVANAACAGQQSNADGGVKVAVVMSHGASAQDARLAPQVTIDPTIDPD